MTGKPELSEKPERPESRNYPKSRNDQIVPAPIYWRKVNPHRSFQLSGRSSFPVVPAFQSFQLSSLSSFPVVPAFRSFQLSGCSSFPVVPAFRSFQLSGCSSFPVISYSLYSDKTNGISKRGNIYTEHSSALPIDKVVTFLFCSYKWNGKNC
jgi:hypothetical protein